MKFRIGILIVMAVSWIAMAQTSVAAETSRFLVYSISSRLYGVGKEYADELFVDLGEKRDGWRGQLIIDTQGVAATGRFEGAIVWSTIQDGEPVMQVVELSAGLLNQTIVPSATNSNQIYSLTTGRDRGTYPDSETLNLVYLEGNRARMVNIGSDSDELASSVLRGQFWLLDETTQSYRWGNMSARLNLKQTRDANVLGDYAIPNDHIVDYNDIVAFYQDQLRNRGYRAITE